jgi:hypothetical protein
VPSGSSSVVSSRSVQRPATCAPTTPFASRSTGTTTARYSMFTSVNQLVCERRTAFVEICAIPAGFQ